MVDWIQTTIFLVDFFPLSHNARSKAMQGQVTQSDTNTSKQSWSAKFTHIRQTWLPTPGTVLFTLIVIAFLFGAQRVGALDSLSANSTSTSTIAYQGRLAQSDGTLITGKTPMTFSIYKEPAGGTALWTETWEGNRAVAVNNGQFSVMLGSQKAIPQSIVNGTDTLYLGVTIGNDEEMNPRLLLGSAPYAFQSLTVPDGSITTAKIADGAVSTAKLATKAVGSAQLADGAVGTTQIADGAVGTAQLANKAATSQKVNLLTGHKQAMSQTEPLLTLNPIPEGTVNFTEIPGSRETFSVDVPSKVLINAVFDVVTRGNPQSVVAGSILVDGTPKGSQAILDAAPAHRASIASTAIVNVDPGTHTIHLGVLGYVGIVEVYAHSQYTYVVMAR
jgi:hypothetical protein